MFCLKKVAPKFKGLKHW